MKWNKGEVSEVYKVYFARGIAIRNSSITFNYSDQFLLLGCGTRADHTVQNHTAVALEHAPRHRVVDTKFAEFNDLTPPKGFNMVQSNWPSSRYPVSPGIHLELTACISLL